MPLTDPPPRYWVDMKTIGETRSRGSGILFTGGMDFLFNVMEGDRVISSYRASYYGGQRYAETQANDHVARLEAAARQEQRAKREAKAARYKKQQETKTTGGSSMSSATEELRTRYTTAIDNLVDAIVGVKGAEDTVDTAKNAILGDLRDSSHPEANDAMQLFDEIDSAASDLKNVLQQLQTKLENIQESV